MVESSGKLEYSEYKPVTYGMPQGSCLGPLIFIIFTNDLYRQIEHSSTILFADDTTLYKSHRNLNYLTWCLQDDLRKLVDWFRCNKLTLNIEKTVCILFQKAGKSEKVALEIDNHIINNIAETKFLGMLLDEHMTWTSHINNLILKITRNSNMLKLNQSLMPTDAKLQIYHAHIASHIQYCILIWGNNASETQLKKLQKIQNTCMRYVLPKTPTDENLPKQSLENQFTSKTIKLKIQLQTNKQSVTNKNREKLHGRQPIPKPASNTYTYNTRNRNLPNLPKKCLQIVQGKFPI